MLLIENIFVGAENGILTEEQSDLWKISINRKYERAAGRELVPKLANC